MSVAMVEQRNNDAQGEGLMRGSLGFLAGLLLCGAALAAQAALLHAIQSAGKERPRDSGGSRGL
jgi:hypothetical protein